MDQADNVKQWSRAGIIIDSADVDEIKYVFELTRDGFIKTEYMSRILQLKANNQTFAIKRLNGALTNRKARKLREIADFLVDNFSPDSGNYEKLWAIGEEELENFVVTQEKKRADKIKSKKKNAIDDLVNSDEDNDDDDDEVSEGD